MLADTLHQLPLMGLAVAFFLASLLYSSVGHGGASAYLAVMGLAGMLPGEMKPVALILNIAVAGVALVSFVRAGHFNSSFFWPLALASIPAAFVGGWMKASDPVFKIILALALTCGAMRLIFLPSRNDSELRKPNQAILISLGAVIGFLSGLIGIGGGIFLTPLLIFFRWSSSKSAAAISAAFILANSFSGLGGFFTQGGSLPAPTIYMLPAVIAGGCIGSWWGSRHARVPALQRTLAVVLLVAAAKFVII